MQFVDARKLQERVQQQERRGVQRGCVSGWVQEWGRVGRRAQAQAGVRVLEGGGALFGLAVGRTGARRMLDVKIGSAAVVAIAHRLLRALVLVLGAAGGRAVQGRRAGADVQQGSECSASVGQRPSRGCRCRCGASRQFVVVRVRWLQLNPCCGGDEWFAGIRRGRRLEGDGTDSRATQRALARLLGDDSNNKSGSLAVGASLRKRADV